MQGQPTNYENSANIEVEFLFGQKRVMSEREGLQLVTSPGIDVSPNRSSFQKLKNRLDGDFGVRRRC